MRYCIFCADVRPPHEHRRLIRFPDHEHVIITLVARYELTPVGREALEERAR